jgi:hypothetical protein
MRVRLAVVAGLLLVLACSKSQPAAGKAVAFEQVCNEADGSRVRLTGYLRYRRSLMSFCSTYGGHKTCDLELYRDATKPPDYDIMHPATGPEPVLAKLSVPVGKQPGEMDDLPSKFSEADIKLHLPSDAIAAEGGKVTVDGKVSVIPSASGPKQCFVTVEWAAP